MVKQAIDRSIKGILHFSGDKDFSYADIAFMASNWFGAKKEQVKPILVRESNLHKSSIKISKTALDISRLKYELGIVPPKSRWSIQQVFLYPDILNGA